MPSFSSGSFHLGDESSLATLRDFKHNGKSPIHPTTKVRNLRNVSNCKNNTTKANLERLLFSCSSTATSWAETDQMLCSYVARLFYCVVSPVVDMTSQGQADSFRATCNFEYSSFFPGCFCGPGQKCQAKVPEKLHSPSGAQKHN